MEILYQDETGWLGRYKEPTTDYWVLCVQITNWSLFSYKKYIQIFADVLNKYPAEYYSFVRGEKEKKFNMLFGFKETGLIVETDVGVLEVLRAIQ